MYCPNCRAPTMPEQNFCRACGTNLRAFPAGSAGPGVVVSSQRRWQIIVDVVTDALRIGTQFLSGRPTADLNEPGLASRYSRLGLIAFWAGLAALLGNHVGVILIATGIGLMAYARGFFGPLRRGPEADTTKLQNPPSRETTYADVPPRPSAAGEPEAGRTAANHRQKSASSA